MTARNWPSAHDKTDVLPSYTVKPEDAPPMGGLPPPQPNGDWLCHACHLRFTYTVLRGVSTGKPRCPECGSKDTTWVGR